MAMFVPMMLEAAEVERPVCISRRQHRFHIITEAASVLALPFYIRVALMKGAPAWVRVGGVLFALSVALVDGALLLQWRRLARQA